MTTNTDWYYRFQNQGDVVFKHNHFVLRRTPKGVWINDYGTERFVLNDAKKQFACPTEEEAKTSFLARKNRQLGILRAQVRDVERAMSELEKGHIGDRARSRSLYFEE